MAENEKTGYMKYLLPIRSVAFLLIFVIGAAVTGRELKEIGVWWSIAASVVNIATILLIYCLLKKAGVGYFEFMGLKKGGRSVKKTVLLTLLFAAVGMSGMYGAGLICYGSVMPGASLDIVAPIAVPLAVMNMILLPLTVSFAEDWLYLGCGVLQIKNRYAAIIFPAFFYALQHCFIPTLFDAKYMVYRLLSFLPLTVIFCIYLSKKRDPLPIIISHALLDLSTAMMILMTSAVPGLYDEWRAMI
ncbi:MAG: hypothetical protein IKR76_01865 [Ruminococcus sp.]|nr:hypothetical protein [Ruminococcus sp.]